jgi:hypothetical protein
MLKLIIPCWGKLYVDQFCRNALPNIRACLNNCPGRPEAHALIFTTKGSRVDLTKAMEGMSDVITKTSITEIDDLFSKSPHPYWVMSRCHEMGIAACRKGEIMFLLPPDQVWCGNALKQCLEYHAAGAKAILVPTLRLSLESMAGFPQDKLVSPTPRELVDLVRLHMHPYMMAFFCDGLRMLNRCNGTYIYPILDLGYMTSSFHMHTLLIEAPGKPAIIASTHDHDLVYNLYPDESVWVVRDSDLVFGIEMSPRYYRHEMISLHQIPAADIKFWMKEWADQPHRYNASRPIRLLTSNFNGLDPTHRARFDAAEALLADEIKQMAEGVPYELVFKKS